jgi:hypothetical protein
MGCVAESIGGSLDAADGRPTPSRISMAHDAIGPRTSSSPVVEEQIESAAQWPVKRRQTKECAPSSTESAAAS